MNQDDIIEAEVEKAEQRYYTRCGRGSSFSLGLEKPTLVLDLPSVVQEALAPFYLDLQEIAELYAFDHHTGEYFDSPTWSLSRLKAMRDRQWANPQIWSLPDDIFDMSGWMNLDRSHRIDDPRFVR